MKQRYHQVRLHRCKVQEPAIAYGRVEVTPLIDYGVIEEDASRERQAVANVVESLELM